MARRNQCDAVARLVQRIKNADIAVTTESENVWDFAVDQILGDNLGTLHTRHRWRPSYVHNRLRQCESAFYHIDWRRQRARGEPVLPQKEPTTLHLIAGN